MRPMTVFEAVEREIRTTEETGYKQIVRVRITMDALKGTPVALPVTPERARVAGALRAIPDPRTGEALVVADPAWGERFLELLLHPADWLEARHFASSYGAHLDAGEKPTLMGLPVEVE